MKNIGKIIIALLTLTCLLCLTACPVQTDADLDKLAELMQSMSTNYTLKITTTANNGLSITEEYLATETNGTRSVDYWIERLNGFTVDGDTVTAPDEYRTVDEGTLTGDAASSPSFDIPSLDLSTKSLSNVAVAETMPLRLTASITSLETFTGKALSGTNATLEVTYTDTSINSIAISYTTTAGNTCTVEYIFN